jgi:hypothetical protein
MRFCLPIVTLFALLLAGCNACEPAHVAPLAPAPRAAGPCAPMAANPCAPAYAPAEPFALLGPSGAYAMAAPDAVEVTVGPNEYARAAIAIPPNVVACVTDGAAKGLVVVGDTLRCIANNLWPNPQPTYRPMWSAPAPAAAPCAPSGTWTFTPAAPPLPPPPKAPSAVPCRP